MSPKLIINILVLYAILINPGTAGILASESSTQSTNDPALELYYSANALYNRNLYELAIPEYKNFLSKYPDHSKAQLARLGLALSYYATGKYDEAEPLLAKLVSSPNLPQPENTRLIYGQTLLMLNKYAEAERILTELLNINKTNELAYACLAEALFNQKKYDALADRCKQLIKLAPDGARALRTIYLCAIAEFERKNYKQAINLITPFLKKFETTSMAQHIYFLLGESFRETGELENAAQNYEIAYKKFKGDFSSESAFRLGWTRFAQKKYDLAAQELNNFIRNFKDSPQTRQAGVLLARCYLETGDLKKSEQTFKTLIADKQTEPDTILWYARLLQKLNRDDETVKLLNDAISKNLSNPAIADVVLEFASSFLEKGDFERSANLFSKLSSAFPDLPQAGDALYYQALSLFRASKYADSLAICNSFLKKHSGKNHPRYSTVSFLQCENLFFMNKQDEALNGYRRFLQNFQSDENAEGARLRLAQILHSSGKFGEALTELQPLLKSAKKQDTLSIAGIIAGDCHYQSGRWKEAIAILEKALSSENQNPYYESGLFRLALAYEKQGDFDKAIAQLEKFIEKFKNSPFIPQAKIELGRILYEKGKYNQALTILQEVSSQNTDRASRVQADYYLAFIALAKKNENEALKLFSKITDNYPEHPLAADARYQQGIILLGKKDYDSARNAFEKFINSNPANELKDQAIFYLGVCYSQKKEYDRAIAEFKKIQNNKSLRERALYEWATCEKEAGRLIPASKIYEQLISEFPASKLAYAGMLELADADFTAKKYDSALARLDKTIRTATDPIVKSQAMYKRGWCLFNMENWSESAKAFEEFINSAQEAKLIPTAAYQAGEARLKLREYDRALALYKKSATANSPELIEQSILRIGECYGLLEKWQDSLNTYTEFLQKFPKSQFIRQAYFGIGWSYENLKKYNQARQAYKNALDMSVKDELSARCQFQIGECAMAEGNYDEAIKELIRMDVNYPFPHWRSRALLEIARALEAKNQINNAKERYKEIIQKYPGTDAEIVARERLKKLEQK